jgi:hypothetical protein
MGGERSVPVPTALHFIMYGYDGGWILARRAEVYTDEEEGQSGLGY